MKSFKEILEKNNGIDYILIEISENLIDANFLLIESQWQNSGIKNYMLRIDSPTNHTQQRHVHIAKKKHINAKTQQVAWNQDTTRHDRKSFNSKLGSNKTVQNIAKNALNLSDDIILESLDETKLGLILENIQIGNPIPIKLTIKE